MANLIKRIAISTSKRAGSGHMAAEFATSTNKSSTGHRTSAHRRSSFIELSGGGFGKREPHHGRSASQGYIQAPNRAAAQFPTPVGNQVRKTEEIFISSEPIQEEELVQYDEEKKGGLTVSARDLGAVGANGRSLDDVTDGGSMKDGVSLEGAPRQDSDDEAYLVGRNRWKGFQNE